MNLTYSILCLLIFAGGAYFLFGKRTKSGKLDSEKEAGEDGVKNSLVFFLKEPRCFGEESLAACLDQAFSGGIDGETNILGSLPYLPGMSVEEGYEPLSFLHGGRMYLVFISPESYIKDYGDLLSEIGDRRLITALEEHKAWISVDLIGEAETDDFRAEVYAVIGALMAEMAGPDIVAIFSPELSRCNEWDPRFIETLRSGNPLEIFEEPTNTPVLDVDGDSPELIAAVAEAKERWPELVEAFNTKIDSKAPFLIKAAFREGDVEEFMWVSPAKITDEQVTGILENSPHQIVKIHEGDEVTLPIIDICDWIYIDSDGEPIGGFTTKVIGN